MKKILNHNRTLESFSDDIHKIRSGGYNPIAVTEFLGEPTFVFETVEEALLAVVDFHKSKVEWDYGWWYGRDEFELAVIDEDTEFPNSKMLIYWL